MEQIIKIGTFILDSFLHIWPYLLITIPLSVIVQFSGASRYISKAFGYNPVTSIFLATAIGAFSPFCSCGVIPVITSLIIGGVPLAPVMSFWIASPSMDPEIFFLSVTTIGWDLSVWRLMSTLVISLLSGLITLYAFKKGFFGEEFLRIATLRTNTPKISPVLITSPKNGNSCGCSELTADREVPFIEKVGLESWKAFWMVAKFMTLAFFINALIDLYLPKEMLLHSMGSHHPFSVLFATLAGIPFYSSNMTALPIISGLISLGMNKGAALAFLIAGPVTTLPAIMAVRGIVRTRVLICYLLFAFFGSLLSGFLFNLFH